MKRVVRLLPHQDFVCPLSISIVLYSNIKGWGWGTGRIFFFWAVWSSAYLKIASVVSSRTNIIEKWGSFFLSHSLLD